MLGATRPNLPGGSLRSVEVTVTRVSTNARRSTPTGARPTVGALGHNVPPTPSVGERKMDGGGASAWRPLRRTGPAGSGSRTQTVAPAGVQ